MIRRTGLLALLLAGACGGCDPSWQLWPDTSIGSVPDQPLVGAPADMVRNVANAPPATLACTQRVNETAQKLLAANPEFTLRPLFLGMGRSEPEIFHTDTRAIYISDGLVNKCANEA